MSTRSLSRRDVVRLLAFGSGAALLSACTGQTAPVTSSTPSAPAPTSSGAVTSPTATAQAAATPVAGGTLRVGQLGDVTTLDPSFSSSLFESVYAIHDRLTAYDLNHQP